MGCLWRVIGVGIKERMQDWRGMDEDLVTAGVGRNDETDMDVERWERRYRKCAVYTEVFL